MSKPNPLREDRLQEEYVEWFKNEYGIPPVITSSSGCPAVRFAQYVFEKYAPMGEGVD